MIGIVAKGAEAVGQGRKRCQAKLKAQFAEQAKAYRELAAERAARYGLPPPSPPPETKPV